MNRRQFNKMALALSSLAIIPFAANTAPAHDYGDPDVEYRDYNVIGAPTSGQYRVRIKDAEKWCERLGLPSPHQWREEITNHGFRKPQKQKMREACREWINGKMRGDAVDFQVTFEGLL